MKEVYPVCTPPYSDEVQSSKNVRYELREWDWVDEVTHAIIIEATVLNQNVNVPVSNRILFEFTSTGIVKVMVCAPVVIYSVFPCWLLPQNPVLEPF